VPLVVPPDDTLTKPPSETTVALARPPASTSRVPPDSTIHPVSVWPAETAEVWPLLMVVMTFWVPSHPGCRVPSETMPVTVDQTQMSCVFDWCNFQRGNMFIHAPPPSDAATSFAATCFGFRFVNASGLQSTGVENQISGQVARPTHRPFSNPRA
jgi:hypothetical protein